MPAPFINVNGISLKSAILLRVEITQELNRHWWCSIECRDALDARPPVEDWLGKPFQVITFDQDGSENVAFDGFVLETELEYEIYGSYRVRLRAVTNSWRLDLTPQEAYYRKQNLQGIASALAAQDGLTAQVALPGKTRNYVQWGETDFQFLRRLADNHRCWMLPTASGIEILDSFRSGVEVNWSAEGGLRSFDIRGRLGQPSFTGTHYNARKQTSTTLTGITKTPEFFGASNEMVASVRRASADTLPSGFLHFDSRTATEDEYREQLESESLRAIGTGTVGRGSSLEEKLRAGDTVKITGANADFEGAYGLIKVTHIWTPEGYKNDFICTPWKKWLEPEAPGCRHIYGVVPARVVDNNDPRRMGRLKIRYDWQESGETGWTRMAAPHAGSDRGFMFMPEVGDEVLVAFEQGDAERPYVLGSLWNGVDVAPRAEFWGEDIAPNDVKRIVTKSGHRIQLVDKEGKETITIATPNDLKITLFEKADETGRPMLLLHSANGDMFFSAPNGRIHFQSKFFSREVGVPGSPSGKKTPTPPAPPKPTPPHPIPPLPPPVPPTPPHIDPVPPGPLPVPPEPITKTVTAKIVSLTFRSDHTESGKKQLKKDTPEAVTIEKLKWLKGGKEVKDTQSLVSKYGDTFEEFLKPEWSDERGGNADSHPISHTRNQNIRVDVEIDFDVQPKGQTARVTLVKGKGSRNFLSFEKEYEQTVGTQRITVTGLVSRDVLPNSVDLIENGSIDWSVVVDGAEKKVGNTGNHRIYVTLDQPRGGITTGFTEGGKTQIVTEARLKYSVQAAKGKGANSERECVDAIFLKLMDLRVGYVLGRRWNETGNDTGIVPKPSLHHYLWLCNSADGQGECHNIAAGMAMACWILGVKGSFEVGYMFPFSSRSTQDPDFPQTFPKTSSGQNKLGSYNAQYKREHASAGHGTEKIVFLDGNDMANNFEGVAAYNKVALYAIGDDVFDRYPDAHDNASDYFAPRDYNSAGIRRAIESRDRGAFRLQLAGVKTGARCETPFEGVGMNFKWED